MKQILWPLLLAQTAAEKHDELAVIIFTVVFLGIGLLWIGLGIPLLYEKIGPNWWYGFRTAKTLSNKEIWYKANKYAAKDLIVLGCIQLIYNLVSSMLPINMLLGNMLILIGGTIIMLIRSLLYLRKL